MKKFLHIFLISLFFSIHVVAQQNDDRIQKLEVVLDSVNKLVPELGSTVDFSINNTNLPTFLRAVASANKVNLSIGRGLEQIIITQSFSNATVKNVLLSLCRDYSLTIEPFGNILSIKKYIRPYTSRNIPVVYNQEKDVFTADIQNDSLSLAFRKITRVTGKNLVFSVGLGAKKISAFIKDMPFEAAIDKIALSNKLQVTKTKDQFYLIEDVSEGAIRQRNRRNRKGNFFYQVKDTVNQLLEVDFVNTSIGAVISDIAYDLKINMATSKPLNNIGTATVKSDDITFKELLNKILEDTKYTYKVEDGMYFFGERKLSSVKNTEIIPLMSRSIQMMMEPMQSSGQGFNQFGGGGFANGLGNGINNGVNNGGFNNINQNNGFNNGGSQNFNNNNRFNSNRGNFRNVQPRQRASFSEDYDSRGEALLSIIPKQITDSLSIKADVEQNSFIVNGDARKIEQFKKFLKKIDKPVPVVLIEVMIIEVKKSNAVSTGIELGIGDKPVTDKGGIYPSADFTIGANTINKVIGGFGGFGSLNIGRVVPNFFAKIQALETNGDLKIHSTPKLSTLNGHTAMLSNGQRSFYAVRQTNTIGSQNPSVIQTVNYFPADANLSINIRPLVSGDGNITLSINVLQSNFNGERIAQEAPPGVNSREFSSTIRVKDQDVIVLGGLEENMRNNSGSGVPFLARIPVIKWLFSKRTRTASKSKLSVLIKPTVIK